MGLKKRTEKISYLKIDSDQCHIYKNILKCLIEIHVPIVGVCDGLFFCKKCDESRKPDVILPLKCTAWYPAWWTLSPFTLLWAHVIYFHFDSSLIPTPILSLVYFLIVPTYILFRSGLVTQVHFFSKDITTLWEDVEVKKWENHVVWDNLCMRSLWFRIIFM